MGASVIVRDERPQDWAAVRALTVSAFESDAEASLVEMLRTQAHPVVSLVATVDGHVVGHILFTPISLPGRPELLRIMGLAPMAVAPDHQRRGIGSRLVRAGLAACQQIGFGAVVVLGHPAYYPRFGFVPAARFGLGCEYDVPEEVFMALELEPGYLKDVTGQVQYHPAFASV